MYFVEKIYTNKYWDSKKLPKDFDPENSLFFDIETTGLSPVNSFVFLIGLAFIKDNKIILRQYFAINQSEEKDILNYLLEDLSGFNYLYHFNGCSFDIPFVNKRLSINNIDHQIDKDASIDIYKILRNNKEYYNFKSYKLQNIEKEIGIYREDDLSGKEVADSYKLFLNNSSASIRDKILLHNEEDIINLFQMVPLLTLNNQVFEPSISDCNMALTDNLFIVKGTIKLNSKKDINISHSNIIFTYKSADSSFTLSMSVQEGNLFYHFKDYKDYYYVPEIDSVIHKSIVKYYKYEHRIKSSADNCYTKFYGKYIQFPIAVKTNSLKMCSSEPHSEKNCIILEELQKNINTSELMYLINETINKLKGRD